MTTLPPDACPRSLRPLGEPDLRVDAPLGYVCGTCRRFVSADLVVAQASVLVGIAAAPRDWPVLRWPLHRLARSTPVGVLDEITADESKLLASRPGAMLPTMSEPRTPQQTTNRLLAVIAVVLVVAALVGGWYLLIRDDGPSQADRYTCAIDPSRC